MSKQKLHPAIPVIGTIVMTGIIVPLVSYMFAPEKVIAVLRALSLWLMPILQEAGTFITTQFMGLIVGFTLGLIVAWRISKSQLFRIAGKAEATTIDERWIKDPSQENSDRLLESLRDEARSVQALNRSNTIILGGENSLEAYRKFVERLKRLGVDVKSFQELLIAAHNSNETVERFCELTSEMIENALYNDDPQKAFEDISGFLNGLIQRPKRRL